MSNGTAKLVGMGDPVKDKEIPCTGLIKIGRDEKVNTCAVKHASVSRQHAQIMNDAGTWMVEDLKSTNGVFVNESKISGKTPLKNGDVVRVGDIPFKFELFQEIGSTQVLKKSDAPAKPAAAAPPPVVKPVPPTLPPRPATPAKSEEGGGEDLFEPSIVGGADMGAAIRAAQAEGAKGAAAPAGNKPPPPPDEEPFEGTMYGPQVARQLVKAIREEKEHAAEAAAKGSSEPTKRVVAGAKVPNMFLLKIKAVALGVVMLAGAGAFMYWALSGREEAQKAQEVMMKAKNKVDQFWEDNESRVLPADPLEQGRVLDQELLKLNEVLGEVKASMTPLEKQPEYLAKVKKMDERVRFLIFERKFKQSILKQDKAEAERQLAELDTNGTPEQKAALPLGRMMIKYQLFHAANQNEPKRAEEAPSQKDVDELKAMQSSLENEYKERSKDLLVLGKRFYNNAKEVIDLDLPTMLAWDRYWLEVKDYEAAKDSEKAAKAEALKKSYPNMKTIQALK